MRGDCLVHQRRPGQHEDRPRSQCGIHEILTQPAEKLLDQHNGQHRADRRHPPGSACWQIERQQQAGHNGAQVADGGLFMKNFFK